MAVACEGQLLLLTQPTDGPVPEPSILGAVSLTEVLTDDDPRQVKFGKLQVRLLVLRFRQAALC